jgi:hypothetical protein
MRIRSGLTCFFAASLIFVESFRNDIEKSGSYLSVLNPVIPDTVISNLPIKVEAFNLNIVPPSSGVQFFKDGIIYLGSSKSDNKMISDHISFGKISARYAVLKDAVLLNTSIFSTSLPFTYPCEAVTFSRDFNTMYFTKYSVKDGTEKIYQAKFSSGNKNQEDWSVDENPMSFCSGQSTYTHPALSYDGKIMIFASNRTGSLGGMDLFITQNNGGEWSSPENLGDAINTKSNELYPYLDSENNLFFSSDGLMGFGGYDIFFCKFKGTTWEKPLNLSGTVNTRFDDVAFTMSRKDSKTAFYTVEQKSGAKSMQLFKVTINNNSGQNKILTLSQYFANPTTSHVFFLPAVEATNEKIENESLKTSESRGKNDNVIYRVQFLTSFNPKTRSQIAIKGKDYSIFEYLYGGAYRLCVGEFSSLSQAKELQSSLFQMDYPQAIVVVFVNNVRSLDQALFKEQAVSEPLATAEKKAVSEPVQQVKPAETKKEVITKPAPKQVETVNKEIIKPESKSAETAKSETAKTQAAKPPIVEPASQKDIVTYRVQIISGNTKKGSYKITINNKVYNTYEYFYSGVYRTCVGDYSTLTPAKELQNICRKSGYPQAFVVAFKNNVRSTDPALFK